MNRFEEVLRQERLGDSAELIRALMKGDSGAKEQVLQLFAATNPEAFLHVPNKKYFLRLVKDDMANDLLALGIEIYEPPSFTSDSQSPEALNQIDPAGLDLGELALYFSPYFSDSGSRNLILDIFWGERSFSRNDLNFEKTLREIWETLNPPESIPPDNLYTLGKTQEAVLQQHNSNSPLGEFPQVVNLQPEEIYSNSEHSTVKEVTMRSYSEVSRVELEKFAVSSFSFCIVQMAQATENQLWFSGMEDEIHIPEVFKNKLNLVQNLSEQYGIIDYCSHLESALAAFISYYYPGLVSEESLEKAKTIKKSSHIQNQAKANSVNDSALQTQKSYSESVDTFGSINFTMNPKVAEHYGFGHGAIINSTPEEAELIFGLADEEPVFFHVEGKPVRVTAKMFRRIFHRGDMPSDEELENSSILEWRRT